jgi:hypothetical protein
MQPSAETAPLLKRKVFSGILLVLGNLVGTLILTGLIGFILDAKIDDSILVYSDKGHPWYFDNYANWIVFALMVSINSCLIAVLKIKKLLNKCAFIVLGGMLVKALMIYTAMFVDYWM